MLRRSEDRDLLARPLADPLAQEVVVVPAKGVERWLTQRLSHRLGVGARGGDGVCAGVDFVTPHSLVSMLLLWGLARRPALKPLQRRRQPAHLRYQMPNRWLEID